MDGASIVTLPRPQESMTKMAHAGSAPLHGSEFNNFLFAPIIEGENGMPLSVLSALARLGVDPWQEAYVLAKLPGEAAAQRLASLFATLPNEPSAHLSSTLIAARLVPLLPRPASLGIASSSQPSGDRPAFNARAVVYILFIAALLGAECIVASNQTAAHVDPVHPLAGSAVPAQKPPPSP